MPKIVFRGHDNKKKVVDGIKNAADIITTTYGGQGGVVMYQPLHGPCTFTKDGFEVSRQVQFPQILENVGAKFVQEACDKIAFRVGDGTTTMAVILSAFIEETFKHELAGLFNKDIAAAIDYGIDKSLEILGSISIKIKKDDYNSIRSVALVSSNYDQQVASFIEEAYKNINKHMHNANPVILIEESKTENSSINIVEGMQLQRGVFSPQFFKKEEKNKMKVEFNNQPYIIVFGKSIGRSDIQQLLHIFDEIIKKGKSCLVVAPDFSEEVINFFLINRHNGISDWVCVKTPGFGDGQLAIAQDIALRTGGKVLCENGSFLPENITLNDFIGSADKICIERDITIIVGGKGNEEEIKARCETLRGEIANHAAKGSTYHMEQLNMRIQALVGVVCIIKLGGLSEMKIKETKDRVEDANHATRHALDSGIVPGGGIDLLYVAMKLEEYMKSNFVALTKYEKLGLEIMIHVFKTPFYKLVRSCGLSGGVCAEKVLEKYHATKKLEYGVDVRTGELINFVETGILNPAAVSVGILNVLREMLDLFIMCNVFIVDSPDEDKGLKEGFNPLS
jgi:chaperonin GroEL